MCGIYLTNIPFTEDEILTKLNKIRYRGPDHIGVIKKDEISLGHIRLSIIDLDSRSNQPYSFESLSMVFNGEIYNYKDIRTELTAIGYSFNTSSDTEVILKGYHAWGEDILDKLNGMFAIAIYDQKNQHVFCARDRLGVKPFYYYWKNGSFEICSQLQPLMCNTRDVSIEAVSIYLTCGYVPSPFSMLEDVYKLQPGYSLLINLTTGLKSLKKYWDLDIVETLDISYDEAKRKLHELIIDSVRIRLQSDVPIGTFLSGGIDSALVTAIASKISNNKIKTFTIGFNDPKFDESKIAAEFSQLLGTDHTTKYCNIEDALDLLPTLFVVYDEPFADSSALPTLLLSKVTNKYVTVALSGDGGDESFLGYKYFESIKKFKKIELIPFFLRRIISRLIFNNNHKISEILQCKNEDDFIQRIFIGGNHHQKKGNDWIRQYYTDYKNLSHNAIQKAADLNLKLWLENDSNVKVDRGSMAYSLEIRSPFLDYRIVEFARKLPVNYRYRGKITKLILKDILSEYIPKTVFNNQKKGFSIPLGEWMNNELKEDILDNITINNFSKIIGINELYHKLDLKSDLIKWRLYLLSKWIKQNHN